ncbi:MAG: lipopolysaccharide biosynthesis protein [Clostridiales bacterium]|nr:lipopolysaccharide biosynthesis protein [Clostridiales bacterium]
MKKNRMLINLIASIVSLLINMGISFFLTPFIVNKIGKEANGFIQLANNFVSYATIITVALNSVAGRFITIKIHEKDEDGANVYFNSVVVANTIISVFLSLISIFVIIYLDRILQISDYLLVDVKITFAIVFINFILSVMTSVFNVATFVRNRLDLSSLRDIEGNFIRVLALIILFYFLEPKVFYVSIAILLMKIFTATKNFQYLKRLVPEIKFNFKKASIKAIKEMVSLGIWNSIHNLSTALLTGLDVFIANIFISSEAMGTMSVAKAIPTVFTTFLSTIGGVYIPKFTILFAEGKRRELIDEIMTSIKVLGLIATVPLVGFTVFGTEFYTLWLPKESMETIKQIQILSILEIGPRFVSLFIYTVNNVFTITKNVKIPVLVTLSISILSTIVVIILLNTTNLGVYAIAGVSSIFLILRVIIFVPTYAAYSLKEKLTIFYRPMLRGLFSFVIVTLLFIFIRSFIVINSWGDLFLVAFFVGALGYIVNTFCILNKSDRKKIIGSIKAKLIK